MYTCQWECSEIVIKGDIIPPCRYVAHGAVCTKLTLMAVVLRVTRKTIFGGAFESFIPVTGKTIYTRMFANQGKCCRTVIEFFPRPCRSLMARRTIFAELPLMDVLCRVTGEAVPGRIFVDPVDMAGFTLHIHM